MNKKKFGNSEKSVYKVISANRPGACRRTGMKKRGLTAQEIYMFGALGYLIILVFIFAADSTGGEGSPQSGVGKKGKKALSKKGISGAKKKSATLSEQIENLVLNSTTALVGPEVLPKGMRKRLRGRYVVLDLPEADNLPPRRRRGPRGLKVPIWHFGPVGTPPDGVEWYKAVMRTDKIDDAYRELVTAGAYFETELRWYEKRPIKNEGLRSEWLDRRSLMSEFAAVLEKYERNNAAGGEERRQKRESDERTEFNPKKIDKLQRGILGHFAVLTPRISAIKDLALTKNLANQLMAYARLHVCGRRCYGHRFKPRFTTQRAFTKLMVNIIKDSLLSRRSDRIAYFANQIISEQVGAKTAVGESEGEVEATRELIKIMVSWLEARAYTTFYNIEDELALYEQAAKRKLGAFAAKTPTDGTAVTN